MINSLEFEDTSCEERDIYYYALKSELKFGEFLNLACKSAKADFGLTINYSLKFSDFICCEPDELQKEQILSTLKLLNLEPKFSNFAVSNESEWNWQESIFETLEFNFLRIWTTSA